MIRDFARYSDRPVINLESTRRHPCQGLADALTLREKLGQTEGKRFVLTWTWHPRALPTAVPASAAIAAASLGMEIAIARPDGYELDPEDTALIRRLTQERGGRTLMVAGGATKDARVDQLRVLRGNSSLWSGNELQTEIARGATLDQLGIRAGDRIQVPGHRDAESTWRIVGIVVGSLATAVGVIALTHR